MKKLYLIFFILISLFSKDNEELVRTLNEINQIAYQNRLTVEKIPSNVTIIKKDFIEKTGAKNIYELLKFIPGIQTSLNTTGKKEIIVRGNKTFYIDKIKFLINGISVTNNLYSNQFYYYNFPTSLIKRVEITLTPDAVTYGDKAFLGVINIITLNNLNDSQISVCQNNKKQSLFSVFQKNKNLTVDTYYFYSNPNIKPVKTYLIDTFTNKLTLYRENSPSEFEKNFGFGIKYKKENSALSYRINFYKKNSFFGMVNLPPLKHDKHDNNLHQYLNYNYALFFNNNWENSLDIGIKNFRINSTYRFFPYDFYKKIDNNPAHDVINGANISEYEIYLKDKLTFINESHISNYFLHLKYAKPYKLFLNGKKGYYTLEDKINKKIYEIGVEDLYFLTDKFSIIYGGRYSHYNDFGSNFSYKIGGVCNLNNMTTFKLLFNTAFRAPTWFELYSNNIGGFNGNIDLKPEKIKMGEFIYRQKFTENDNVKFSFYLGKETQYIGRTVSMSTGSEVFANLGDFLIRGYEISYDKDFEKGFFGVSYSYNNNKALFSNIVANNINEFEYLGIRKNLYKTYLDYTFRPDMNFFISGFYGSKIRAFNNTIDRYISINTNISFHKENTIFKIGVDNITNHKNYYYSPPNNVIAARYAFIQKDLKIPDMGRKFYINFMKKW